MAGHNTAISRLKQHGIVRVQELFKEKHYKDLDGGILEGFGRLLKFDLRIYVYPTLDPKTGQVVTAENVKVCACMLPCLGDPVAWSGVHGSKEACCSITLMVGDRQRAFRGLDSLLFVLKVI